MAEQLRTPYQRWAFHSALRDAEYAQRAAEPAPQSASERLPPGSYAVRPGLLAGEYPAYRYNEDPTRLEQFLGAGVRVFLDLTEPHETPFSSRPVLPYAPLLQRLASQRGLPIHRLHHPVRDGTAPGRPQMRQILDTIDQAHADGQTVYVHCLGGVGRTGTVVGCYLVRHGATPTAALRLIAHQLYDTYKAERLSPETDEQRTLVLRWQPGT